MLKLMMYAACNIEYNSLMHVHALLRYNELNLTNRSVHNSLNTVNADIKVTVLVSCEKYVYVCMSF